MTEPRVGTASLAAPSNRRRGRPRGPTTDRRVIEATIDLLAAGGTQAATIDAIARASGSAKTTIYRRWSSRDALLLDALRVAVQASVPDGPVETETGSSLEVTARRTLAAVRDPLFRAVFPTLAHELLQRTALGERYREDVFGRVRSNARERFRADSQGRRLRPTVDPNLVFDLVHGALIYRMLVGEEVDTTVVDALIEVVLAGALAPTSRPGAA